MARRGLVSLALALCACGSGTPPNLLLVVVDTLRADHLGSYGYPLDTSPRMDALAREGVRFERAYATAPWTMPSVASILTGREPSGHGVMRVPRALPPASVTLAERLRDRGYRTGAVTSHILLERKYGFDQGFDVFETRAGGHRSLTGGNVSRAAIAMLEEFAGDDDHPFFGFVHYFDPHYAYREHPEYSFATERSGRVHGGMDYRELLAMRHELTPEELAHVRGLYDEEVRYSDEQLRALLDALEELSLADRTLVVLTADHGEEFMEHGWIGHTTSLRDPQLRVPLIVREPGFDGPGRVVPQPVSLAGLAPTLLERLGVAVSADDFDAPSFADLLSGRGGDDLTVPAVFAEVDYRQHRELRTSQRMLLSWPHKLVADRLRGTVSLFDLSEDAGELRDLAGRHPQLVARLRAELERHSQPAPAESDPLPTLPDAERRRLRELGYVE